MPAVKAAAERDGTLTDEQMALFSACDSVRLSAASRVATNAVEEVDDARAKEAEAEASKTPAETFSAGWTDVVEHWFVPLTGVGILVGALLVGMLVLARFVSLTRIARRGFRRSARWVALPIGLLLILASSVNLAILLTGIGKSVTVESTTTWFLVATMAAAALGIWLFARWLASRLRLEVDVFGSGETADKKDELATARVVNLLHSLAGTPPRGLDVPVGTDVQALTDGTLPTTIANKVLSVVQSVVGFLFLGTPWRVTVRTDGDNVATVTVTHNGESVTKSTIDLSSFELPEKVEKTNALRYFAAAAVIMALRNRNPGFEALAGATDWRSLGLQALGAATFQMVGDSDLESMLEDAVELDPGNNVAVFALENTRHRQDTDRESLSRYARDLKRQLVVLHELPGRGSRQLDIELRVRLVLALVTLNIWTIPADQVPAEPLTGPPTPPPRLEQAMENVRALIHLLGRRGLKSPFYEDLRRRAGVAHNALPLVVPPAPAANPPVGAP